MTRIFVRAFAVPSAAIDAMGHVNNVEYVRWMQDVAAEHSAAQGWPLARYVECGAGWVVHSHAIEYLRPAFAGETLALLTWVADFGRSASRRRYLFHRPRDDAVLAKAETRWAFVDFRSGAPIRIPEALRAAFDTVADEAEALRLARGGGAQA